MKYLLAYTLPLSCLLGLTWGGAWSFLTPAVAFGLLPVLEFLIPAKDGTPTTRPGVTEWLYDGLIYLHVPFMYILLFKFFYGIHLDLYNTAELLGLTISEGIILGSFGMNLGHELGHRQGFWNQLCANLFWLPNLYMHFGIEHNLWHHKYVATDMDPASAPEGMSLYQFWVTSVMGNMGTAWKVERLRIDRLKEARSKGGDRRIGPSWLRTDEVNKMIVIILVELGYLVSVSFFFGLLAGILAVATAIIGFLLLETVNYVEHYGLRRRKLANGRYEAQGPQHSWNSNHEMGRIFLYELVRHPDHHMNASKKYQTLEALDGSPQLPYGYPACVLMAFLPWVWKKRMGLELERQVKV
jgi:alkane 1-monooxygenase